MKDGKMLCFKLKNGVHSSSVVSLVKTDPNQSETVVLLINEQQHTMKHLNSLSHSFVGLFIELTALLAKAKDFVHTFNDLRNDWIR